MLKVVYYPKDVTMNMRLIEELTNCKLTCGEDGEECISKIQSIRRKLNENFKSLMSDEDFLMRIYINLNDEDFKYLKMGYIRQMSSKIETLDMDSLRVRLRAFQSMNVGVCNQSTALETRPVNNNQGFIKPKKKGQFQICGKNGHREDECRFKLKCITCVKVVHTAQQCCSSQRFSKCGRSGHLEHRCWRDLVCEK